jgi:hypothetical protein
LERRRENASWRYSPASNRGWVPGQGRRRDVRIAAAVGVDYPEAGADLTRLQDELVAAGRRTLGLRAPRGA